VSAYIDEQRDRFGVEPICRTLGVPGSAYYQRKSGRRSERAVADERPLGRIGEPHPPTTTPTAIGAPGRRCCAPASESVATASSG
jgi:hypothetical protein